MQAYGLHFSLSGIAFSLLFLIIVKATFSLQIYTVSKKIMHFRKLSKGGKNGTKIISIV